MTPKRALAVLLGALTVGACTFSTAMSVRSHQLLRPVPAGLVNVLNVEEQLDRGFVPEVVAFLEHARGRMDETRFSRLLGRALLECGDFRAAHAPLELAHAQDGRLATRAETAWLLSQGAYWQGDFLESARWARVAQSEGRLVPGGWERFLRSAEGRVLYDGVQPGERLSATFAYGRPDLMRLLVSVNGARDESMVLDTGASISLLTESAAKRAGLEIVEGAEAYAQGLHDERIPLRFGWAREVKLGGRTLKNVPFGILADDALSFATTAAGSMRFSGVLGVHLLKEFDWRIEYSGRRALAVRLDPAARRGSSGQNVFFRRLKPMVRASFNQEPWYLFLLDTGSEPTMVTRAGIRRQGGTHTEGTYPMTLEGIGQSHVSWGKMSNATVGVDRFMIRFADVVVKEESPGIEDGIVGSSFLGRFDVDILFGAMRLKLSRPLDRYQEALVFGAADRG